MATPAAAVRNLSGTGDDVTAYAEAVGAGEILACKQIHQAAARHVRDLAAAELEGAAYYFDRAAALRAIAFFGYLVHFKGSRKFVGKPFHLEPWQRFIIGSLFGWKTRSDGLRRFRQCWVEVPRKNGKALAIDTPILTPNGWRRHGDLRAGDAVFSPSGFPVRVLAVGMHHVGPTMRVRFSDGESVVAHERHEWATERSWYTGRRRGSRGPLPPVETRQLAATLRQGTVRGDLVHRVPVTAPLQCQERSLPVPPYTLGAWLGDGTSSCGTITSADPEVPALVALDGFTVLKKKRYLWSVLGLQKKLHAAGVLGKGNKHIPPEYFTASHSQRLELLRGLIDTDGHVTKAGQVEFVSTSERLAGDFILLARTLGLKPTLTRDRATLRGRDIGPRFRVQLWARGESVAALPRKAERLRHSSGRALSRMVVGVDPAGDAVVNCIEVEGGLYLAGEGLIATHNSSLSGGLLLLLAFFDDEAAAEVYCVATKRDQAKIVFDAAKEMLRKAPHLHEGPGGRIEILKRNLSQPATLSKIEPLGRDSDTLDGLHVHAYVADEVHKFKSPDLLDVLETATGARDQPIAFEITTAGSSRTSIAWDHHDYSERILKGTAADETWFAFIATIDEGDPWESETTWRKANPNWSALNIAQLRALANKAKQIPSQLNAFLRLHLNVWTESVTRWIPDQLWMDAAGPLPWPRLAEALTGRECYGGLDLASTRDLNALGLVFPDVRGEAFGYDVLLEVWIPEDAIDERSERDGVPYRAWVKQGLVHTTPGNVTDHRAIRQRLEALALQYRFLQVGFDRWGAGHLVTELGEDGLAMVPMGQGMQTFAPIVKEYERLVALAARGDRLFRHGGNPVLRWAMANVALEMDAAGNFKFSKRRSSEKIDPVVAVGMALGRAVANAAQRPRPSKYEKAGFRAFGSGA